MSVSLPAQSAYAHQSHQSPGAPSVSSRAAAANAADQSADAQPLTEQMKKKLRRSSLISCPLDRLAKVELQLMLQFLDTNSRLMAARCSRTLLQAADHPFVWQGPSVVVHSFQLDSLIPSSLLRLAPIALQLDRDLPAAQVAAIPRLRELTIRYHISADVALQVFALASLQRLQTLQIVCSQSESALRLLPMLPSLRTLHYQSTQHLADSGWLPSMPALTDLNITCGAFQFLSLPVIDAIGQCSQLHSLRLRHPRFKVAGAFARFCATPALRGLRCLALAGTLSIESDEGFGPDECCAAFSALVRLESLHLEDVDGVDRLLAHLVHAPALRTLTIACAPDDPYSREVHGSANPSRAVLQPLLTAAPRLHVRLAVAATVEQWYDSDDKPTEAVTALQRELREQADEQWHEMQRMAVEIERVTIADRAVGQ